MIKELARVGLEGLHNQNQGGHLGRTEVII